MFVVYGVQFSFGTFVDDIVATTGWSESRLQLIFAIYIFGYSALSAVSGVATDRLGPRRVVGGGAILLMVGWLIWARASSLWWVFLGLGVIAPIGMSASWVPCNATVVRWFVARRGTAVAVATAGGSVANIVVPPVAATLVERHGWRTALTTLAIVGSVVMLGAALVMRRDPESIGQYPDGRQPIDRNAEIATGLTRREAMRTRTFWLVFGMYAISFLVIFVPLVHVNQHAIDVGISPITAATVISAIGVGGLVGRLGVGPTSDVVGRRAVVVAAFALQALGFVGLALSQSLLALYAAAAVFGFAYGAAVAAFPPLVGDYFGRAHAGAIVGALFASAGSLAAVGPWVAQLLVDATGSYRSAFLLCGVANAAAVALATRMPRTISQ